MKKFIMLLFCMSMIQAMDQSTRAQRLLQEIRAGDISEEKKTAAVFLAYNYSHSWLINSIRWHRERTQRVNELQQLIDAPVQALQSDDPKTTLKKSIDAIVTARQHVWWREYFPRLQRFFLSETHQKVIKDLQNDSWVVLDIRFCDFCEKSDITAAEIEAVMSEVKRISSTTPIILRKLFFSERTTKITNLEILDGMVRTGVIDAGTLFGKLDLRTAAKFLVRHKELADPMHLVTYSTAIDELLDKQKHPIYKNHQPYSSWTDEEFQKEKEHILWKIRMAIKDYRVLRFSTYHCLRENTCNDLDLDKYLFNYIKSRLPVENVCVTMTSIPWFIATKKLNPYWRSPEGTTALDLLLQQSDSSTSNNIPTYIQLLRSAGIECATNHQAELEDKVLRSGRLDTRFDGLVTDQERAEAQASDQYVRAVKILATAYPNSSYGFTKL